MRLFKIHFSPTGGTKKVLDIIADSWKLETVEVNLCDAQKDFSKICLQTDDICLVAVPSFGGRVPGIAISRIKEITGNNALTVMIAVYGNRAYEDTLLELKNALQESGCRCIAAIAAIAEHSIMHQFATARPDEEDRKELMEFASKVKESIEQHTYAESLMISGNTPYREYNGVPFKPKAGKGCNKCGVCARQCPVQAITVDDLCGLDENRCISCMRCVSICPQQVRTINKAVLFVASQKMKKVCSERKVNELFL